MTSEPFPWTRGAALIGLSMSLQLPLFAQVASPTDTTSSETGDEVIKLSPFEVRTDRDVGYTATSTLAGSRMNSDLRDTPSAISVMNREFLDDIGALSVNDTVEFAMNMTPDVDATGNSTTENNFNFRVRGIGGAQRARNYFRTQLNADLYNVDRIDLARGPNSILFGEASPAGLINTSTKFARIGRTFGSVQLRTGSYGEKRGTLDYNLSGEKAAVRVNLLAQDTDGYRDFEFQKKKGLALAGAWRPFRQTQIRIEGEKIKIDENRPRPWTVWDGYTAWVDAGSPLAGDPTQWGQTLGTNISNRLGNNQVMFFQNGPLAGQALFTGNPANANPESFRISLGARNIINTPNNVLDESRYPRDGNPVGPTARSNSHAEVGGIYLEQTIGEDLTFELAAGFENETRVWNNPIGFGSISLFYDVNAYLPQFDAQGNQTGIVANPMAGKPIIASTGNVLRTFDYSRAQYRATGAYHLDFRKLMKRESLATRILGHHRIAGLVSSEKFTMDRLDYREVNTSPNRIVADYFNTANAVIRVNYYDPFAPNVEDRGLFAFEKNPISNVPIFGTSVSRPQVAGKTVTAEWMNSDWRYSENQLDTRLLAAHSYLWDDRIVLLFGYRHDDTKTYGSDRVADPVTNRTLGYNRRPRPDTDTGGNTSTRGIVFHATKNISLFYNEADNFAVQTARELFNDTDKNLPLGNRTGVGKDAGIKLSLFGGKIYSSLAWYETADAGQATSVNGNYRGFTNRIWEALNAANPAQFPSLRETEGDDTVSLQSEGYEFELTANPTRQLRLAFNFKKAKTTNSDLLPNVRAYLNANRATWEANSAVPLVVATNGALTIGELLPLLDDVLNNDLAAEGRAPVRDREITANLTANYTFDEGFVKGFGIGSAVQYRGKSVIGYRVVTDGEPVYAPSYTTANGWLSYNRRINEKINMRLQLNVNNLFNFDKPQPVASAEPTVIDNRTPPLTNGLAYVFYLPTPRTYSLSATFSF